MKAAALAIPEAVLKQHVVVLGKTGAGKSSVLRHLVESLLAQQKRVCIIDPKGDWWGLPSSGSGDGAGFPVVLFGDFKNKRSDVPMDARAGRDVAQIISSSNQACVLGFRGWMPGSLTKFWLDFAPELFNSNQGELYLVIDEVHNFAPKGKILSPQAGEMIHWTNRLASEGRGLGLKLLIASQRPQKVHNDTLTCCETLIAMRVVHPADRAALKDWMDECGDAAKGKDVLAEVSSMKTGQAWVWFPDGAYLEKVQFPMFRSFDSFSDKAIAPPKTWAKVDVDAVRKKLARVVKEQEDNDPGKLRGQLHAVREQFQRVAMIAEEKVKDWTREEMDGVVRSLKYKLAPEQREPQGLSAADKKLIEDVKEAARELMKPMPSLQKQLEQIVGLEMAQRIMPAPVALKATPSMRATPLQPAGPFVRIHPHQKISTSSDNGAITGGKRRMMIALAQRPGLSARQLGVRAGMSSKSGTFGTYLAALRTAGWMEGSRDAMELTEAGRAALGNYEPLPTGRALLEFWLTALGASKKARMLQELAKVHPNCMTKEELGHAADISHNSGTFGTYLATLRTLELISGSSELKASDELFD